MAFERIYTGTATLDNGMWPPSHFSPFEFEYKGERYENFQALINPVDKWMTFYWRYLYSTRPDLGTAVVGPGEGDNFDDTVVFRLFDETTGALISSFRWGDSVYDSNKYSGRLRHRPGPTTNPVTSPISYQLDTAILVPDDYLHATVRLEIDAGRARPPYDPKIQFLVDFADDGNYATDITDEITKYQAKYGTEVIEGVSKQLVEGARGIIEVHNNDAKYTRASSGTYSIVQLSRPHKFRMNIDGTTVLEAIVAPPEEIDTKDDERVIFNIESENDPKLINNLRRAFLTEPSAPTATQIFDAIIAQADIRKNPAADPGTTRSSAFSVDDRLDSILWELCKFSGSIAFEMWDGSISMITVPNLIGMDAKLIQSNTMQILRKGLSEMQDLTPVRNQLIMRSSGISQGARQSDGTTLSGERELLGSYTAELDALETVTVRFEIPPDVVRASQYLGTAVNANTIVTLSRVSDTAASFEIQNSATTRQEVDATFEALMQRIVIVGTAVIQAPQSITDYGLRQFDSPPWINFTHIINPTGGSHATDLARDSKPPWFLKLDIPLAQETRAYSEQLRDLRVGDPVQVDVNTEQHTKISGRSVVMNLTYEGAVGQLNQIRVGLMELVQTQGITVNQIDLLDALPATPDVSPTPPPVTGEDVVPGVDTTTTGIFVLDQSNLDGTDVLA